MLLKVGRNGISKEETPKKIKRNYIQTGMIRTYFLKDKNGKTIVRRELISAGED